MGIEELVPQKSYRFLLIGIFFLTTFLSFSQAKKDSSFNQRLELGSLNDNWGGVLVKMEDDYRSFGFFANWFITENKSIHTTLSSLTNKNWRDTLHKERLDEYAVNIHYPIRENALKIMDVNAVGGFILTGNLGGEVIQQFTHNYFGMAKVSLPYSNKYNLYWQVGGEVKFHPIILHRTGESKSIIQPSIYAAYTHNYVFNTSIDLPYKIVLKDGDYSLLGVGYSFNQSLSKNEIINTVYKKESGFYLSLAQQFDVLTYSYKMYINNDFSLGTIGINLFKNHIAKREFQKPIASVEVGTLAGGYGFYNKYSHAMHSVFPVRFLITINNEFGASLKKHLPDYPNVSGHYKLLTIGGDLSLLKHSNKLQFNPYLGFGIGVKREMVYSGKEEIETIDLLSPAAKVNGGIKVSTPLKFLSDNNLYGLDFHFNYNYPFMPKEKVILNHIRSTFLQPSMMFGVGMFVVLGD
ncbi:MAG: hypothetical protein NTX03_03395 [Bacteroidetes bacterium]|nr:hypothetical protein [Bacteroidota bacterium]